MAEALAARLTKEAGTDSKRIAERAWELAAGRAPNGKELEQSMQFLKGRRPLREFALAVLNLNVFAYVE